SLANGTDGHRRGALTTHRLRHWVGQGGAAAHRRLSAVASGRDEARRTDESKNKRRPSRPTPAAIHPPHREGGRPPPPAGGAALPLAVMARHTGGEGGPASLSGGETFYTSLALALGMADVVRAEAGGVDLDTLFIDEGFGSLDSGTLDQVMAVIDDLRDRGRVIGIVSHVADLRERVPERLAGAR